MAITGKKVLIVDYDARAAEAIARLFQANGLEAVTATDGVAAWEKYLIEKPDLVILEAILPRFHGFDLTKRIVQESKGKVPVIIVTGLYRGPQYRHEALTSFGASDFMEKPVDEERLLRSAMDLLGAPSQLGLDLPSPEAIVEFLKKRLS